MNDHDVALVRESFDLIEPIGPQAGGAFRARLVDADPSLRRLFVGEPEHAWREPMQGLARLVARLDEPEALAPLVQSFGQRLAALGVRDADYDAVAAALIATLREGAGVAWTPEVEAAWDAVIGEIVGAMKEAAAAPASIY